MEKDSLCEHVSFEQILNDRPGFSNDWKTYPAGITKQQPNLTMAVHMQLEAYSAHFNLILLSIT